MPLIPRKAQRPPTAPQHARPARWTTQRLLIYACALVLVCEGIPFALWWWQFFVLKLPGVPTIGWDFAVYWSASKVAMPHGAAAAYNWELLRAAQAEVLLPAGRFGPFAYPPTFLLLVYPVAALPFGLALGAWVALGTLCYLLFLRSVLAPLQHPWLMPALAFPGLWAALAAGQNSLFTMVAAGTALLLMRRRPLVAGACIAVLCIKPQLGVLFPLFLLCRRQWTTLAWAAIFSLLYCGVTWLAFGTETFLAFAHSLTMFRRIVAEHGIEILHGAPTVFAVLRVAGVSISTAYLAHAIVAALAIACCAWLWRTNTRFEMSAAALPVATLMLQPYLVYYDLAWLALTIAFLTVDYARHGCDGWEKAALLAGWLIPMQAFLAVPIQTMSQWAPAVLILLLAVIMRRQIRERRRLRGIASGDAAKEEQADALEEGLTAR